MLTWTKTFWDWYSSLFEPDLESELLLAPSSAQHSAPFSPSDKQQQQDLSQRPQSSAGMPETQSTPTTAICTVISLSQWLSDALHDQADKEMADSAEDQHAEQAAFEIFVQGYSLL